MGVPAAPDVGIEQVTPYFTMLSEVEPYEWWWLIAIGLIAALTFVLGTFFKEPPT